MPQKNENRKNRYPNVKDEIKKSETNPSSTHTHISTVPQRIWNKIDSVLKQDPNTWKVINNITKQLNQKQVSILHLIFHHWPAD